MTPQQKMIEYYFYHYHEYCFVSSKKLSSFQNKIFPPKTMLFYSRTGERKEPDAFAILMGYVVEKTYFKFTDKKRELLKMKYFLKYDRNHTCKRLGISQRTYHRYTAAILQYAEAYMQQLKFEEAEYKTHVGFFKDSFIPTVPMQEHISSQS